MSNHQPPPARHRVVVIGSGFGGLFATKALRRADVDITVIDRTTHHLFQPLLYQVATGILSEGEIAPSTRMILKDQANAAVRLGDVTTIDLTERTVTSEHLGQTTVTGYDSLIVSAGAQQSYFGNDHFAEHAPGMKTIDDALELRGRILGAFEQAEVTTDPQERARLLTFVVVGAGPTGVEMAGQIAELAHRTLVGGVLQLRSAGCTDRPARRSLGGTAAVRRQPRFRGGGNPRKAGCGGAAGCVGDRRRRRRTDRSRCRRHRAPHRVRLQGLVRGSGSESPSVAGSPNSPVPTSTVPVASPSTKTSPCRAIRTCSLSAT